MLFQDLINFLLAWCRSRKWLRIGGLGVLVASLPIAALTLVISGVSTSISVMATSYHDLIEKELEPDAKANSEQARTTNRKLQVPLRRILQMDEENVRARYFVAYELAQQGRLSMATRMMREVAPIQGAGYPDAHAWLAAYSISKKSQGGEVDFGLLMHDLEIAVNKSSFVTPSMIVAYAALLRKAGRSSEALALLRSRRSQFPDLNLAYAELAELLDEKDDLRIAIEEGREDLEKRFKSGDADESDVVRLVQLAMLDKDVDRAIAISQTAINRFPATAVFRQLYSSALFAKYASLDGEADLAARMQYLDAAFKANPANTRVVAEVSKAIASGEDMPESLRNAIEESLADGSAPAVAHLILANNKLAGEDPQTAIAHLELALRQMPNSAVVMNNLAVAILKTRPEQVERADQLVAKALTIPGSSTAMLAAMLDTQGQVRLAQEDNLGAIDCFEKAIRLDTSKMNTRQRLADAYREVGMTDLAAVQMRRIAELKEQSEQAAEGGP